MTDQSKCWHKRTSTTTYTQGEVIAKRTVCLDCGLVAVFVPCTHCGNLYDSEAKGDKQ